MKLLRKKQSPGHLNFVFAGLFIGLGLGILYNKTAVGTLLGLGFGFLLSAMAQLTRKIK